jgi:hypothetical protein
VSISKTNLVLEFDDFHWRQPENCLKEIEYLISKFPDIKLSLFCTPALGGNYLDENTDWCNTVKFYIDSGNIRLGVHGLYHNTEEFKYLDYASAHRHLEIALDLFKRSNLPVTKCFRGPHWGLNENAIHALNALNFTHLYSHNDYKHLEYFFEGKVVYYNWNLKDEIPNMPDLIIGHGHTHNVCQNGISESIPKIVKALESGKYQTVFIDDV